MKVHLLADPSKVRVGVRKTLEGLWRVSVSLRDKGVLSSEIIEVRTNLVFAIGQAIGRASDASMPGLNPHLLATYEHPFHKEGS